MDKCLNFKTYTNMKATVEEYLLKFDRKDVLQHLFNVIDELEFIKKTYGYVEKESYCACLLHDIGKAIKDEMAVEFCLKHDIEMLEIEKKVPAILHQKTSEYIAKNTFKVTNEIVLDAIRHHTTLKANPSRCNIELFIADKMSFKDNEYIEVADKMKYYLKVSKELAIFTYLKELHEKQNDLNIYHPQTHEAYLYFKKLL
ncbi:MAG: putative nicotinate-nucleotide adenylyltransferase [Alphaproteobacteria bacterium ADurb.Bin438]|nr:MAG: putative nicotinate-nucleotide adenylyltransferase [Alphaproteobacteria bacterium ADurb.Bin438]